MNKERVAEAIKAQIGGNVEVRFNEVRKNNRIKYGVSIGNGEIAPTFYYDPDLSDTEIIECVVRKYKEIDTGMPEFDFSQAYDREYVLPRVIPQIVKRDGNPYVDGKIMTSLLDLAVLYRVCINENLSFVIPDPVLRTSNYTKEELHTAAVKNATKAGRFYSMFSLLKDNLAPGTIEEDNSGMYIITNDEKRFGAAIAFLVEPMLFKAGKVFGDDVLILPLSIHECIVIPATGASKEDVNAMVKAVNENEVQEEEVLSDHAYIYRMETGKIEEFI